MEAYLGYSWEGTVKLHRATAPSPCVYRGNILGGKKPRHRHMLCIGAVGKLCCICYPEHKKTALIWFEQSMTHSEIFFFLEMKTY